MDHEFGAFEFEFEMKMENHKNSIQLFYESQFTIKP